jgi:hypothetical protein
MTPPQGGRRHRSRPKHIASACVPILSLLQPANGHEPNLLQNWFCRNFCANSLYPIAYFSHRSVISSNLAAKRRVLAPFRAAGVRPSEVAEALHPWPAAAVCDPTATWPIFAISGL